MLSSAFCTPWDCLTRLETDLSPPAIQSNDATHWEPVKKNSASCHTAMIKEMKPRYIRCHVICIGSSGVSNSEAAATFLLKQREALLSQERPKVSAWSIHFQSCRNPSQFSGFYSFPFHGFSEALLLMDDPDLQ